MPKPPVDSFEPLPIAGRFTDAIADFESIVQPTTAAQLADDLKKAGINPDRSSCPSLLAQLRQSTEVDVDTILCCAIDSDPLMPVNATVARESNGDVAAALQLLSKLVQPRRVLLVAEPAVLAKCKASHRSCLPSKMFRPVLLRADYPLTDARLLLRTILRRTMTPHELPTQARTLILDAVAAAEIGRWAKNGVADATVRLAVRDHVAASVKLVRVVRDSTVGEILSALRVPGAGTLVRSGDYLRDLFVGSDHPVGNSELCLHVTAPHRPEPSEPCIRCAWCVEACPARIQPAGLLEAAQRNDLTMAGRFGLQACIECGICSYVCPSHLPLLPAIRGLLILAEATPA